MWVLLLPLSFTGNNDAVLARRSAQSGLVGALCLLKPTAQKALSFSAQQFTCSGLDSTITR